MAWVLVSSKDHREGVVSTTLIERSVNHEFYNVRSGEHTVFETILDEYWDGLYKGKEKDFEYPNCIFCCLRKRFPSELQRQRFCWWASL